MEAGRGDVLGDTTAVVVGDGLAAEELEGGEALDLVLLGELGVGGGIDLGDLDGVVELAELLGGSGVLGGELLAVAAPLEMGRPEGGIRGRRTLRGGIRTPRWRSRRCCR